MKKYAILLLACLLLFLPGCGKAESETKPKDETETSESKQDDLKDLEYAAILRVKINPEMNLFLDAENQVLAVEYLNDDAKEAFSKLSMKGITLEEAMKQIIATSVEKGYLTDGKTISVDVVESDEKQIAVQELTDKIQASVQQGLSEQQIGAKLELSVAGEILEQEEIPAVQPESVQTSETPKNPCSVCGGTGNCQECKGDGYRGSGYTVSCPRCHGSLTETCIYCDAAGNSNKHEGVCDFPNCMGAHIYACTTCKGGSSPVTCNSCGGTGNCSACNGTGEK